MRKLEKLRDRDDRKEQEVVKKKIAKCEERNLDLQKEIKLLRRLQHHQGNRLVDIESTEAYPDKIKQLMEERKYANEKLQDTKDKIRVERA